VPEQGIVIEIKINYKSRLLKKEFEKSFVLKAVDNVQSSPQ
jgi:hypothetical protein